MLYSHVIFGLQNSKNSRSHRRGQRYTGDDPPPAGLIVGQCCSWQLQHRDSFYWHWSTGRLLVRDRGAQRDPHDHTLAHLAPASPGQTPPAPTAVKISKKRSGRERRINDTLAAAILMS